MSEPKLISPMLDAFDMGGPISDHDGVKCCPAMRKNSDDRYIVKIISVPASQAKLDALLLTGAFSDKDSAVAYFKELADGIVDEKKILDRLAELEGFISYEDCQIVPMDDGAGYDVYLLSPYRKTLERENSCNPMTQLSAVNLALDLCAGLAVCRRTGYMCVDLKPSNIFVVGDKEYRIGDLGFVRLNSLKYESLPDKYRSCYTAPEVEDAFATLSSTMDIYSVGVILYQIFNGGVLPFSGKYAPAEKFPAPVCADSELADIILKACDPDPAARWQDPVAMGQAIVSYMQKNGVNDTPLVVAEPVMDEEEIAEEVVENESDAEIEATLDALIEPELDAQDVVFDVDADEEPVETQIEYIRESEIEVPEGIDEIVSTDDTEAESIQVDNTEVETDFTEESDVADLIVESEPEVLAELETEQIVDVTEEEQPTVETCESTVEEYDNLSFLDDLGEINLNSDYENVTEDISDILGQIDELTAHEVPSPVIAPEPIEITIPISDAMDDSEIIEDTSDADESEYSESDDDQSEEDAEIPDEEYEEIGEEELPYIPKKKRTGLIWCIVIILLLALGIGGYFFYTQYYLQPIHALELEGTEDRLQIQLITDADESLLTVICADSHGNKVSSPVVDGCAVFSGLAPDTAYTISIEIDGFHQLTGITDKVYSTPIQTKVAAISAITGAESGSVILSFAVEGPDSDQWNVIYNAEGEAERVTTFPSHMVTLAGLTIGKEYTFKLEPVDEIYLSDEAEINYIARNLICAENLRIIACADGILTVQWDTPQGEAVTQWSVRCYNESGFDETITTDENTVSFENIDDTVGYIVEVTAAEMSVNRRIQISENSVTVSNFTVNSDRAQTLSLQWEANRAVPAEGWTVRYSVNGVNSPSAIITTENAAEVPVVPNGDYVFTIYDSMGNAVLGGPFTHSQNPAATFDAYSVTNADITLRLCKTPAAASWSYKDLSDEDYVNTFSVGQKMSIVLALANTPAYSDDTIVTTFAVYDENDQLVSYSHISQTWQSMWYQNYSELDIPVVPTEIGTYNLIVYFNGAEVGSQKFAITA